MLCPYQPNFEADQSEHLQTENLTNFFTKLNYTHEQKPETTHKKSIKTQTLFKLKKKKNLVRIFKMLFDFKNPLLLIVKQATIRINNIIIIFNINIIISINRVWR